jgi:hypothetical protein
MAKYLNGSESTLWTVGASLTNSTLWRKIIQTRDTNILQKFIIKLGSGKDTQAVGAPWFSDRQRAMLAAAPDTRKVADLWDDHNQS